MNRVMRGTVVLAAALATVSCQGDPTSSLRNGIDHLVATPSAIFVGNGTTKTVIVIAVDKQGNALGTSFSVGSVGAGITVVPDDSFNLVYDTNGKLVPPKNWTRARFIVGTGNYVSSSFVVTAGGKSITIPVRTAPLSLTSSFVTTTPAIGDTVTLAAPAGLVFDTTATTVTFTPGGPAVITSLTQTSVSFIPIPGSRGPATVTNITPVFDTALGVLTLATTQSITVPPILNFPATFSNANPGPSDTVTITLGAGYKFRPSVVLHLGSAAGTSPLVLSSAADSSAISFIAIPGSTSGPVYANGVILAALPAVPLSIPSAPSLTVSAGYAGTAAYATATTLTFPASGNTSSFFDVGTFNGSSDCTTVNAGGADCRIYKFVLAAPATITFTNTWNSRADLGLYFANSALAPFGGAGCDAKGNGANAQPEVCTIAFPAGTFYMAQTTFAAFYPPPDNVNPTFFRMDVHVQ